MNLWFRSALFNVLYIALTACMVIVGLPLLVSQEYTWRYVQLWARTVIALLRIICRTNYEVKGSLHITSQPVIYACKHQSAWDVFILLLLLPRPMFVLKRELLHIPIIGWFMRRAGVIPIDRGRGLSAMKGMIAPAKAALHAKRPLVIYPEGTRKRPGAEAAYLPGVAALYTKLMVPVVPVALNSGLFWGRNAFIKKPGTITIEFLPAIAPGLARRELMAVLQHLTEEASAKLLAETR